MKTVVIIQARMGSTRLPGKVLKDLAGRPMLERQLHRLQQSRRANACMIATSESVSDEPIVALAHRCSVPVFRGSEHDVLARFVGAATLSRADLVVRCTADCPLIDPGVLDRVIEEATLHASACDYVSNVMRRTYPRGLDVEAFFFDVLLRIDRFAKDPREREHVTVLPRADTAGRFICRSVEDEHDRSHLRWTVDTEADLAWVRRIWEHFSLSDTEPSYEALVQQVLADPSLVRQDDEQMTWDPSRTARS